MDDIKKLLEAKMLLDTFEIPPRPMALSAHQYRKKFGSTQGFSDHKKQIKLERKQWDEHYKNLYRNMKTKSRHLVEIDLSDEALAQAEQEARSRGESVAQILSSWLEKGRQL